MALLSDVIQRGTRAAQPAATAVATGTLYGVTDEGDVLERSNGTTWDAYAPAPTDATAFGSEPASPSEGQVDLYTNAPQLGRYNGSAWAPWGPIFALTAPVNGDFSWVNQGSASVSTTNGGIHLLAPLSAGVNIRARVKSAPATPYTITAAFLFNLLGPNYQFGGLLFRDSAGGAIETFGPQTLTNVESLVVNSFTSATVYSATPVQIATDASTGLVFLRITDNGVNRIYSFSRDGSNFVTVYTVARTTFLTANQVGFFAAEQTNTYTAGVTLLSWLET